MTFIHKDDTLVTFSDFVRRTKIGDIFWFGKKPYRRGRGIVYVAWSGAKDPTIRRAFEKRYLRRAQRNK